MTAADVFITTLFVVFVVLAIAVAWSFIREL